MAIDPVPCLALTISASTPVLPSAVGNCQQKTMIAKVALLLVALPALVWSDCYMHFPRGSNDRLNENTRDRSNGNRMFDSQNNNRGGVNVGTFGRPYYYIGSILPIEWTNQHSCGPGNNNDCTFIIQYYCDASNLTRDGLTTTTIPDADEVCSGNVACTDAGNSQDGNLYQKCINGNCDGDYRYGRHESWDSYRLCKYTTRNKGLWISSQDLTNGRNGAIFTRQNNNGDRHAYECPEERDYYPYWRPSIWVDIAILTNDYQTRCPNYVTESQNVKSRFYCKVTDSWIQQQKAKAPYNEVPGDGQDNYYGFIPIDPTGCTTVGGVWTEVKAWNFANPKVQAPYCGPSPWTRDNHLGNHAGESYTPNYNWTIPDWYQEEACVLRIRYNISSAETRNGGEWFSPADIIDGNLNRTLNANRNVQIPNGLQTEDNNANDPTTFKYPTYLDVWSQFGLTAADQGGSWTPVAWQNKQATRGYVFSTNPTLDIFGSLITGGQPFWFMLAINTNQYPRTFQDRSHVFSIRKRPSIIPSSLNIHNLGVRGKRGNIVQTYPGTEYGFVPGILPIQQGDFIHFQWTGSNTTPAGAGQGTESTDRSNVILLRSYPMQFPNNANVGPAPNQIGSWKQTYPMRVDDTTPAGNFAGFTVAEKSALAMPGVYTPLVDVGPIQVRALGTYNYVSTRNNNFSNRDQKGEINVLARTDGQAFTAIDTFGAFSSQIAPSGNAWLRFYPDPMAYTTGSQITITESNGIVEIMPIFFDVVKGQQILLEMKYSGGAGALTIYYIYQSFSSDFQLDYQLSTTYSGGIAQASINNGGWYRLEADVAVGPVVGIVIGIALVGAGGGFLYWKLKKQFNYGGKKKHLMVDDANTATETVATGV